MTNYLLHLPCLSSINLRAKSLVLFLRPVKKEDGYGFTVCLCTASRTVPCSLQRVCAWVFSRELYTSSLRRLESLLPFAGEITNTALSAYLFYNRAMSRVTSIHKTEMNNRIPLCSSQGLNGVLKIFPKVGTKNAQ